MTQEIESVKPALTVILDDGDFIINSTGAIGKLMSQAILPLATAAKKVTIITDGEMKVLKRAAGNGGSREKPVTDYVTAKMNAALAVANAAADAGPDVQDQFAADLEAGRTGEQATGEVPSPTPGPSDPVKIPTKPPVRRQPQIFQDAAAPPAPELAEAEMDRLLAEAAQAEQDAAKVAEDQRFQRQQAVQAGGEQVDAATAPAEAEAAAQPRRRTRERALATTGRPCGKCGGSGQTGVEDPSGRVFTGICGVCHGEGQVKTWDRRLKVM